MTYNRLLTNKDLQKFYQVSERTAQNYLEDIRESFEFKKSKKLTVMHLAKYEKLPFEDVSKVLN